MNLSALIQHWRADLDRAAASRQLAVSTGDRDRLVTYLELLYGENQRFDLTAVPPNEYVTRHLLDSLTPHRLGILPPRGDLLDVGSGAGLPGIPLAICSPALTVHLLESQQKRVDFLELVVQHLALRNVEVICGRAERLGCDQGYRERFEVVTARAVAHLGILAELTLPLTRLGGEVLAFKGEDGQAELVAAEGIIRELGGEGETLCEGGGTDGGGTLIRIVKRAPTPDRYPRSFQAISRGSAVKKETSKNR